MICADWRFNPQIDMYQELEIPCRVLNMPTEELGAPAYRKYVPAIMHTTCSWSVMHSAPRMPHLVCHTPHAEPNHKCSGGY